MCGAKLVVFCIFLTYIVCARLFAQIHKPLSNLQSWTDSISKVKSDTGSIYIYGDHTVASWKQPGNVIPYRKTFIVAHKDLTLKWLNARFDPLVAAKHPGAIFVHLGGKEVQQGVSIDSVIRQMKVLLRSVHQKLPGVTVVLLSAQFSPKYKKHTGLLQTLNQRMADLALTYPNCAYIDCISFMTSDSGRFFPQHFESDSITLSREGYTLWSQEIHKQASTIFSVDE